MERKILLGVCALAASFLCLLVESPSTCFLYPHFTGTDSSIFQYIGRIWGLGGALPYRDAFDHKGPFLFGVNALGYVLTGNRYGIFAVQTIFFAFAIILVYKSVRLRYCEVYSAGITVLFIVLFSYFSSEGNLTEEYSIALLMPVVYLTLKYTASGNFRHKPIYGLIYGISIGAMLMMRINNAVLMLGLIFGVFLKLVIHKEWKNLWQNILAGCIGISVIVIPFWIYFAANGAGYEMWYATLLFNIKYSKVSANWYMDREACLMIFEYSVIAMMTAAVAAAHWIRYKDTLSAGCLIGIVVSELTMISGRRYKHYFMLYVVLIPVLFFLLSDIRQKAVKLCITLLCILAFLIVGNPVRKVKNDIVDAYKSVERDGRMEGSLCDSSWQTYNRIAELIPDDEKNLVAGYNMPAGFWLETGLDSCYKYFVFHDFHSSMDNGLKAEMTELFLGGRAKWIVQRDGIKNEEIEDYILQNYETVFEEKEINLYRRK